MSFLDDALDYVSDVGSSALDHIQDGIESAGDSISDTWTSIEENWAEFKHNPLDWAEDKWDKLEEDLKEDWDVFKDEFTWSGLSASIGAALMGMPLPAAMGLIFGSDTFQAQYDYIQGDMQEDIEDIEALQELIEQYGDEYLDMQEELMDMALFFDEIYVISESNRTDRYHKDVITPAEAKLARKVAEFNERWGSIMRLNSDSTFGKLTLSGVMVIGGVMTDIGRIFDSELPGADRMKAAGRIILLIVSIVILVFSWGTAGFSWEWLVGLILFWMSMDAGYGQSGIYSAILSFLDLMINDLLEADELFSSRLAALDDDHELHAMAIEATAQVVAIATIIASMTGVMNMSTGGGQPNQLITSIVAYAGVIQKYYAVFQQAMSVYDFVEANKAREEIERQLEEALRKSNDRLDSIRRKRFLLNVADFQYVQSDADEIINNFVLKASSSAVPMLDPESMVLMNTRFKQEPIVQYGFEEVFNSGSMAGDDNYHKEILYGI